MDADLLGGRSLLGLPDGRHLGTGDRPVAAARVAVRDDAVADLEAGVGPLRDRAGRAEVDVVRVGGDHQDAGNLL